MNVPAAGFARPGSVVEREAVPCMGLVGVPTTVDVRHDGLGPVAQVLKHLTDAALVAKAHHHESLVARHALEGRRVAPVGAVAHHQRLVIAEVGRAEQPHLVDDAPLDEFDNPELTDHSTVVHAVGLVERAVIPGPHVAVGVIPEPVGLGWEPIHHDSLRDLIANEAAGGLADIGDVLPRQPVRVVPSKGLVQRQIASGRDPRIVHDHEHLG